VAAASLTIFHNFHLCRQTACILSHEGPAQIDAKINQQGAGWCFLPADICTGGPALRGAPINEKQGFSSLSQNPGKRRALLLAKNHLESHGAL